MIVRFFNHSGCSYFKSMTGKCVKLGFASSAGAQAHIGHQNNTARCSLNLSTLPAVFVLRS